MNQSVMIVRSFGSSCNYETRNIPKPFDCECDGVAIRYQDETGERIIAIPLSGEVQLMEGFLNA